MNLKRPPRNPLGHPEHQNTERRLALLDTVMDSYVLWRDDSRAVRESYRRWLTAGRQERDDAFARYVTALDRQEHAARGYWCVVEHTHAYEGPQPRSNHYCA